MRLFASLVLFFFCCPMGHAITSGDSLFLKLHFVYGSKPRHAYRATEKKYFGGIHGGHVYMEAGGQIFSFGPNKGQWHIFNRPHHIVGCYRIDKDLVWCGDTGRLKMTTISIPLTEQQMEHIRQLRSQYMQASPYDYAFFGMRCAAAAYDVLSQAGISRKRSRAGIIAHNFYPKRLRIKLLRKAAKEHWSVEKQAGRLTRKWEKD